MTDPLALIDATQRRVLDVRKPSQRVWPQRLALLTLSLVLSAIGAGALAWWTAIVLPIAVVAAAVIAVARGWARPDEIEFVGRRYPRGGRESGSVVVPLLTLTSPVILGALAEWWWAGLITWLGFVSYLRLGQGPWRRARTEPLGSTPSVVVSLSGAML